ncbi:MAG: glutamate--tRNA ligase [Acidimicrobiales bacterium]|nr:glutamate--tRNA ligase [Acidimicrobiales bacterium]
MTVSSPLRVRFAPSPTGYLHIGSARTALFNWLTARHGGGQMLLRIEDTDADRSRPELIDLIFRTLGWLGLDWDGEVVHQSKRADRYRDAVESLLAAGHAYWCECRPDEVKARAQARGGKPGYDGHCRDRELGPGPGRVVRFRTPDEGETVFSDVIRGQVSFPNADLEDFVIVRSNGVPMFHVANAVDDLDMEISHVIRGEDLLPATPKILLLRRALSSESDPLFAHLPLIVNEKRQKLSKRRDDVAVEDYIERGYLPEAMANYLATLGWGPPDGIEIRPMPEIIELFELSDVTKSSAFFDIKKLDAFNGEYIRALPVGEFINRSTHWLFSNPPWPPENFSAGVFEFMAPHVQERVRTLSEVPGYVDFLFLDQPLIDDDSWQKVMEKDRVLAIQVLDVAIEQFESLEPWESKAISLAIIGWADSNGVKRQKAQAPVRVAITGRSVGPPLWESIEVLGRGRTLERLRSAKTRLATT